MKSKTLRVGTSIFLAFFFLVSSQAAAVKKNIAISLNRKEIRDMTTQGLNLFFYIRIANSSSSPLYLDQYDYRVVIQERDFFSLKTALDKPIFIPAEGNTLISLPVKVTYSFLFEAVPGIENETRIGFYVTGLMMFSDGKRIKEKVPFAFAGEFPVFRGLEVDLHPIQIKDLSLGGTEFSFVFSLKNPNSFDLTLGRMTYKLRLGGKPVADDQLRGGDTIEGKGEKRISMPLVLDFFEVGRDLQAILQQPSVECEFSMEGTAESAWGGLKISVSRKEIVAVEMREIRTSS
ncbi:MAG: LEA type 2 family protein [Clostridiales bacterium]|nr:LEA type 2 family protein [Clostridiales bacterium]